MARDGAASCHPGNGSSPRTCPAGNRPFGRPADEVIGEEYLWQVGANARVVIDDRDVPGNGAA